MPSCSAEVPESGPSNPRPPPTEEEAWIAIGPPGSPLFGKHPFSHGPPSFESAQFDIVLRPQHQRQKQGSGLRQAGVPSRYAHLSHTFEFAGWGTLSRIDVAASKEQGATQGTANIQTLGQFTASSVAGTAVLGSIFYALPVVFAVSSVYSPISLFVATLTLFFWRPIMEELASALPLGGAPYSYLINVSSKSLALVGAAALLLDYAATAVVSAATAATYLDGEVNLPFSVIVGTFLVLLLFAIVSLSGIRESARIAFAILSLHAVTMIALFIASIVAWAKMGNSQIRENWHRGTESSSTTHIPRQIFDGICIGMLGLTGFECVPSYASSIKPGRFPRVLRNIHLPAIVLNTVSMLFVLALVPYDEILDGTNVLSVLAQIAAGRWLRIWVVVDAITVLCTGVLAGVLGTCELISRLTSDRLLPQLFLRRLPITQAPYVSVIVYTLFCCVLYASTGASLVVVSKMFTVVWLFVMTLFPLSNLLLKFDRGRLSREPRTPILVVFTTFGIAFAVIGGNIALDPTTIGYSAAYFAVIASLFLTTMKKGKIVRWFFWLYDQFPRLHRQKWSNGWEEYMGGLMRNLRRQPVCVLTKTDEINRLFHKLQYVSQNEETSCLKLVHFYNEEEGIPSEMEANWKILDEAFPEITIDLVLARGDFNPANVAIIAKYLAIPTTLMFMSCPGPNFPYSAAELNTRIISL